MAARRGANRYPRPGQRIAPPRSETPSRSGPPSGWSARPTRYGFATLTSTSGTASTRRPSPSWPISWSTGWPPPAARRAFDDRHFPRPPEGICLADLGLEHRTSLCLAREGFDKEPGRLGQRTIGQILAIRAFGPRCLVDLLTALETRLAAEPGLCGELTAEARRLADVPEAAQARGDDPRFGPLIQAVDVDAPTAGELAERLLGRAEDPPDPLYAAGQVRQLRERIAGHAHADAGRGADPHLRLHAAPAEPADRDRLLRLGRRPAAHAGRDRGPLRHDPRADPADLRQAGQAQEPRGHPGAGDGPGPGLPASSGCPAPSTGWKRRWPRPA